MFFTESGKGFPVVLLHGFCESNEIWKEFREALSSDYRIICPDFPGFGKSPLLNKSISIESVADDLFNLLSKLDIVECVIIGHSLGGYVTLAFAEKYDKILKAFGLFHSSAFPDSEEKKDNRNKTIEFIKKNGPIPFVQTLIPSLFNENRKEEFQDEIDDILGIAEEIQGDAIIKYLAAMRDRKDRTEVLKKSSKPILFIAGEYDTAIPIEKSKAQASFIDKSNVLILKNSGHMGMIEEKEESLRSVRDFLITAKS